MNGINGIRKILLVDTIYKYATIGRRSHHIHDIAVGHDQYGTYKSEQRKCKDQIEDQGAHQNLHRKMNNQKCDGNEKSDFYHGSNGYATGLGVRRMADHTLIGTTNQKAERTANNRT